MKQSAGIRGTPTLPSEADERVRDVRVTDDTLSVDLMDGRTISVPIVWFPRLLAGTAAQRSRWKIIGAGLGIHWPDLDEDISTPGLLRGTVPRIRNSVALPSAATKARRSGPAAKKRRG